MKKRMCPVFILSGMLFMLNCATTKKFVPVEPEKGKSLLIGAALVENDGIDDVYEAITKNIVLVIVGKTMKEGKEVTKGYRVKTDKNGYFALQNVDPGSYVLKGFEVDLAFSNKMLFTSRWEGNTQIFSPAGNFIDNNVRIWPPVSKDKVINFGIHSFRIDAAKRVFDQVYSRLDNARLGLKDVRYTMLNPKDYFKQNYPNWGWFR